MSTVNEPERTERPEQLQHSEQPDGEASLAAAGAAVTARTTDRDESDTAAEPTGTAAEERAEGPREADDSTTATTGTAQTSVYVRRGRTPTLGFWVAVAIALPAVVALISAPFFDFADLGGVLNFVLLAAVMIGLPLATIAAIIDSVRHRRKRSPQR